MGRDFAKRGRRKTKTTTSKNNHWLWLLSGACIGILLSALSFFKLFPESYSQLIHRAQTPAIAPEPAPVVAATKAQATPEKRSPHFDFYSLLPELEVNVDAPPAAKPTPTPAAAPTQTTESEGQTYRLQFGSFRHFKDADRLKAEMAMLGVELEIEAVTLDNNETWYRVRSTTFNDRESAERLRSQLQAQSIKSLLLEEKG